MHQDYLYQAGIAVGCEGPGPGVVRTSPVGMRRSRDGAHLQNVLADARHWHEAFLADAESWSEERRGCDSTRFILLENPRRAEVEDALVECGQFLHQFSDRPDWNGGSLHFAFSGHGTDKGELVLADGEFSPDELIELIAATVDPNPPKRRRLGLVFDSCFSGLTLARIIVHPAHGSRVSIPDGFAAALHDEFAWELDSLGHGALTFTMQNPGNAHVDRNRLAKAVEQGDEAYLRLALQGFVPNPVTYLTEGDQHSLDLTNGHWLEIKGWGGVDVLGDVSLDELLHALERIRSHPEPDQRVEIGK
jgi:hypothetical protein